MKTPEDSISTPPPAEPEAAAETGLWAQFLQAWISQMPEPPAPAELLPESLDHPAPPPRDDWWLLG